MALNHPRAGIVAICSFRATASTIRQSPVDCLEGRFGLTQHVESPSGQSAQELWTVHQADARDTSRFLEDVARRRGHPNLPFVGATITSPPYANIVDYGVDRQIGYSQTYEEYMAECANIFAAIFKWTQTDGSLWIVADTVVKESAKGEPGRLIPLPFELAQAATNAGWVLRDVIIWRKDRTRPWSNRGRLRNGFEYVLYFVKSKQYKYHVDRLRDTRALKSWWVRYPERHNPWGMAPDNVWEIPIPVQGSWATPELRHACPLPQELVRRILMLSTDPGDIVFDPFAGSGMVAAVSEAESRLPLGTELNGDFVESFHDIVRPDLLASYSSVESNQSDEMTKRLLTLRVLKYPKDLMKQLFREGIDRHLIQGTIVMAEEFDMKPRTSGYAAVTCAVLIADSVTDSELKAIDAILSKVEARPPLSKYSMKTVVSIQRIGQLPKSSIDASLTIYRRGQTWRAVETISAASLVEALDKTKDDEFPPVLSPLSIVQVLEEH